MPQMTKTSIYSAPTFKHTVPLTYALWLNLSSNNRHVHVQIIRRVITHHTICFYSQNTLFLKIGVNQSILFIYFSTFLFKDHLYSKEYTTQSSKKDLYNVYRGFSPYATFGTWKKFALAKNRISKIFVLCTQ